MPLTCAEVETMLGLNIPEDAVVATFAGAADLERDDDAECLARLPEAVRATFVALPVAQLAPEVPEPRSAAPAPAPAGPLPRPARPPPSSREVAALLLDLPDRGMAAALGGMVGFGAGHVHARDGAGAALFAVVDVALLGAIGASVARNEPRIGAVAGAGLAFSRAAQIASAPMAAQAEARRGLGIE